MEDTADEPVDISTHTLTWSVTKLSYSYILQEVHFNSHAHVERDTVIGIAIRMFKISTHTLTWSVTIIRRLLRSISQFQLTRSRGA